MSIGLFIEKGCAPSEVEISKALGPTLESWKELSRWLAQTLRAQRELRYMYGKKYGWALRFQIGGRLLCALYPTQSGFTVQVILNQRALEQVTQFTLSNNVKQAIDRAHLYAEGKWLFIPFQSEPDMATIKQLLMLKAGRGIASEQQQDPCLSGEGMKERKIWQLLFPRRAGERGGASDLRRRERQLRLHASPPGGSTSA